MGCENSEKDGRMETCVYRRTKYKETQKYKGRINEEKEREYGKEKRGSRCRQKAGDYEWT